MKLSRRMALTMAFAFAGLFHWAAAGMSETDANWDSQFGVSEFVRRVARFAFVENSL